MTKMHLILSVNLSDVWVSSVRLCCFLPLIEAVTQRCSVKKVLLEISQNSPEACNFIKKETDIGVFLWILRNFQEYLFYKSPPVAASALRNPSYKNKKLCTKRWEKFPTNWPCFVVKRKNFQKMQKIHATFFPQSFW